MSFLEAHSSIVWRKAKDEKLHAPNINHIWDIVPFQYKKRSVVCQWIYKIKYKSDGSIERYKARPVGKGYAQTYGVDYKETFAPIRNMSTIRVLMLAAINYGWSTF